MLKKKDFWILLGSFLLIYLIREVALTGIIRTLINAIFGGSIISHRIAQILICVLCGAFIGFVLFRRIRDDQTHRREFLEYFSDKEYTAESKTEYINSTGVTKRCRVMSITALGVFLFAYYILSIFISPTRLVAAFTPPSRFLDTIITMIIDLIVISAVMIFSEIIARKKLYDKWFEERIHK